MTLLMTSILEPLAFCRIAVAVLLTILFLQSGIDKITDWKGNLSWLTGHFEKSPLSRMVPFMLGTLTLVEIAAGVASLVGVVMYIFSGEVGLGLLGAQLSAVSIVMLFFGQRMAKDYPGAASLAPYFILSIGGVLLWGSMF